MPSPQPPRPRPSSTVRAELVEVRRHLGEAPPHHGAGLRASLQATARRLEQELAEANRVETGRDH